MAVLYLQAFVFVLLMGKLFKKIFFGELRAAEMEHLIERSWYAVTETCLAFTVFRDDFSPKFVASFTLLLFLKCFHWLAEDRVDLMERSPNISFLFHVRVMSLLTFLSLVDSYFVNFAYYSTLTKGASVQLVFGFEYAILLTIVLMAAVKYVLHSIDMQSENPWESKAVYLLYSELVLGFVKVILYIMFMVIMIKIHTFPLFAIRPMYLSVRNFKKSLHDVIMSRRAIRQMNTLYPDVTPEELQTGDNVCIICREEMVSACKKLPCNHIFHTSCLRSWFQRQQTCPTCRMEVLRIHIRPPQATPPPPQPAPQQQQPFPNMFGGFGPGAAGFPPMWPPQMPPQAAPGAAPQAPAQSPSMPQTQAPGAGQTQTPATATQATPTTTATPSASPTQASPAGTIPSMTGATTLPGMPPFMPMFPPMFMPNAFPRPPTDTSGLSEEELRAMEGTERENIEARIQWLRDIQALLDGAMLLMQQYNIVAANTSIPGINATQRNAQTTSSSAPSSFTASTANITQAPPPPPNVKDLGARPKYSSPTNSSVNKSQAPASSEQSTEKVKTVEGATAGLTPSETVDEIIPEWSNPRTHEHSDELDEVRRRRLEKFVAETALINQQTSKNEEDKSS